MKLVRPLARLLSLTAMLLPAVSGAQVPSPAPTIRTPTLQVPKLQLPSDRKQIHVVFPHSLRAQSILVKVESDGSMSYQEDILIHPSQIPTDTLGNGTRPVDKVLHQRRTTMRGFSASGPYLGDWGLWDEGVVPYTIRNDVPARFRTLIEEAVSHINAKTHLCVRPKRSTDSDFIEFVPVRNQSYGGQSFLGRIGGKQRLNLDIEDTEFGTVASRSTIIHELAHAVGMIHEQCRSDRDQFVEILWDNIHPELDKGNFMIDPFSRNHTEYDFRSRMHYSPTAFGRKVDGKRLTTIRPLDAKNVIDPAGGLTALDVQGINSIYRTTTSCEERTPDESVPVAVGDAIETITYNLSALFDNVTGAAVEEGTYRIKCLKGGRYLKIYQDAGPCAADNGTWVVLHSLGSRECDNRFAIKKSGAGYTMKCGGKYADINLGNLLGNVRLKMWEANGWPSGHGTNQQWMFYKVPGHSDKFVIRNIASGKVLDANNDCTSQNDCKVKQYDARSSDPTQVWVLEKI